MEIEKEVKMLNKLNNAIEKRMRLVLLIRKFMKIEFYKLAKSPIEKHTKVFEKLLDKIGFDNEFINLYEYRLAMVYYLIGVVGKLSEGEEIDYSIIEDSIKTISEDIEKTNKLYNKFKLTKMACSDVDVKFMEKFKNLNKARDVNMATRLKINHLKKMDKIELTTFLVRLNSLVDINASLESDEKGEEALDKWIINFVKFSEEFDSLVELENK